MRSLKAVPAPRTFTNEEVTEWLGDKPTPELLDELAAFGDLMINEVANTTNALDAKAIAILGWAGVPLGFLIVGSPDWVNTESWGVVAFAFATIGLSLTTIYFSAQALRTRGWQVPSQGDWFKRELFATPDRLKAYHVISKLNAHRDGTKQNACKSLALVRAEAALAVALVLMGAMALVQTVALFVSTLV